MVLTERMAWKQVISILLIGFEKKEIEKIKLEPMPQIEKSLFKTQQ